MLKFFGFILSLNASLPTALYLGHTSIVVMIGLASLALWSFIAVCPPAPARALVLNLYNVTSPGSASHDSKQPTFGVNADTHCTNDPNWLAPAFPTISLYNSTCQTALFKGKKELVLCGLDIEYELLERDATA